MKNILDDAAKMFSFIKQRSVLSEMLKKTESMDKQHISPGMYRNLVA
jgi:hypothetical protein